MPNDLVNASRDVQRLEARSRGSVDVPQEDRDLSAGALDTTDDGDDGGAPPQERQPIQREQQQQEPPRQPQPVMSPFDRRRQEIISAYREGRNQPADESEEDQNAREIRELSNEGLPPELRESLDNRDDDLDDIDAQTPQPEPSSAAPRPDTQGAPEDRRHKLIVRGKEVFVTDAELMEHAQKSLAHDDYLGEARSVLEQTRATEQRLNQALSQVPGSRQPAGTHPAGQEAQPGGPQPEEEGAPQADPIADLVDAIQFGDRELAINRMRDFVTKQVPAATSEEVRRSRIANEWNTSMQVLDQFSREHEEVSSDPMAQAAMHSRMLHLQREDLRGLGIPEDQLKDDVQVARRHLAARTDRLNVRDPRTLLDTALTDYNAWRGVTPQQQPQPGQQGQQHQRPAAPQPPAQQQQPQQQPQPQRRVEVTLNRDTRRAAIPQQPERTVAPRPQPQPQAQPQPRDKSDVVRAMQRRQATLRGTIAPS